MKYSELPKWAQKQAKEWTKKQYLQIDEEARQAGEDVPYYTESELEAVAMEYLNDKDDFIIEYDEEGKPELIF